MRPHPIHSYVVRTLLRSKEGKKVVTKGGEEKSRDDIGLSDGSACRSRS